jgi:adenine deaminase
MEIRSAAIHRKMSMPARQLPITESAHKATVVGDEGVSAVFAPRDVAAERGRAAVLDGGHHLQLIEAHVTGICAAPRRSVIAEDIRDLQDCT